MSDVDALRELVLAALERLEAGEDEAAVLNGLCAEHPQHADALRSRLASLRRFGVLQPRDDDALPEQLGEFRLLRPLGGGRLGGEQQQSYGPKAIKQAVCHGLPSHHVP